MDLNEFRSISDVFELDVYAVLSLDATLAAKSVVGGTSPEQVRKAIEAARESLK